MKKLASTPFVLRALSAFMPLVFSFCSSNSPTSPAFEIDAGPTVVLISQSVSPTGADIVYSSAVDSLSGIKIHVPQNSLTGSTTFNVGTAHINKHNFRADVTLLSPLISFSNSAANMKEEVTITIPIRNPTHRFALPFLYDERTHKLEALTVIEQDSAKIVFIMTNFRNSHTSGILALTEEEHANVVIASTSAELLSETYDSGFEMGIDNCQFINYGSYLSQGGHCGGQTIATAWYYETKAKKGSPGLYGLYDNDGINRTPKIWEDDQSLYRFCSVLQVNAHWTKLKNFSGTDRDIQTYKSIAFAIRETGSTQPLYVYDGDLVAHAILATKTSNGIITVADPNYFTFSTITLDKRLGDFAPYNLSRYVGDTRFNCIHIFHAALSQLIDFEFVANEWKKVQDGTIGNDYFPSTTVKVLNSKGDYETVVPGRTITVYQQTTIDVDEQGITPTTFFYDFTTQNHFETNVRDLSLSALGKRKIGVAYSVPQTFPEGGYVGFQWIDLNVVQEDGPKTGSLKLTLSIDSKPATVEKAEFRIIGDSEHGYFLGIRADVHNDLVDATDVLDIKAGILRSGTYDGILQGTNTWLHFENKMSLSTDYIIGPDGGNSNMKVLAWRPDLLEGSFSGTFISEKDKSKSAHIVGSFRYP